MSKPNRERVEHHYLLQRSSFMTNSEAIGQPAPKLTVQGIKRLIRGLDGDLAAVQASSADPALKKEIQARIADLKIILRASIAGGVVDMTEWAKSLPKFAALTPLMKKALGLEDEEIGACFHDAGCINTTSEQCHDLEGFFDPGVLCPRQGKGGQKEQGGSYKEKEG
jgi:hypothetical protein